MLDDVVIVGKFSRRALRAPPYHPVCLSDLHKPAISHGDVAGRAFAFSPFHFFHRSCAAVVANSTARQCLFTALIASPALSPRVAARFFTVRQRPMTLFPQCVQMSGGVGAQVFVMSNPRCVLRFFSSFFFGATWH